MFINSWGDDGDKILKKYRYYTPNHDNVWGDIIATNDIDKADYLIVLEGFPRINYRSLIKNKNKFQELWYILSNKYKKHPQKIFLQREPVDIKEKNIDLSKFVFDGSYEKHYHVSTWMIKVPFKELEKMQKPVDTKPVSATVSGKDKTVGQQQRLKIVKKFAESYDQLDIFGKGLESLGFGSSYKGPLNYNDFCKLKGLYGYKYSLAFENSSHENYFTEKIIDCFLSWTKPIYWGCPNIHEYFPKKSYAYVDIFDKNAPEIIAKEISKPVDCKAIKEARDLVLYKYNIWPSVSNIIGKLQNADS